MQALDAIHPKTRGGVAQQADGFQRAGRYDRLEDIEFEMALRACESDGRLIAEDARADHGQRLRLGGIDLARHDGGARLVLGQQQLAKAAARPAAEQAHVVGDLEKPCGAGLKRPMGEDQRVMAGQRLEFVGRGDEGQARQ